MNKSVLVAALIAASLAGCDNHPQPVAYQQPQVVQQPGVVAAAPAAPATVIVQQPANNGTGDMLAAGAVGYMLGRSSSGPSYSNGGGTTVNKTVIVNQPAPTAPAAAPVAQAPQRPLPPPTVAFKPAAAPAVARPAAPTTSFKPATSSFKPATSSFKPSGRR